MHGAIDAQTLGQFQGGGAAAHVELVDCGEGRGLQVRRILAGGATAMLDGGGNITFIAFDYAKIAVGIPIARLGGQNREERLSGGTEIMPCVVVEPGDIGMILLARSPPLRLGDIFKGLRKIFLIIILCAPATDRRRRHPRRC